MSDLRESILRAAEFGKDQEAFEVACSVEESLNSEDREYLEFCRGRYDRSTRLQPLLLALADVAAYVEDAPCECSVAERASGHLVGCCWMPELDEKLASLREIVDGGK